MVWMIAAVLFLLLGLAFHRFELYEKIIGYARMSDEEKEEAQPKPISHYIAINAYIMAGLTLSLFITGLFSWPKLNNALFILSVIVFFWSLIDIPRYIRLIKDEASHPVKLSNRNYLKWVRLLSTIGVLIAFFVYLLLR